ncbi:hypothetical protein [Candidatus Entotheonella palauensis]|uniref:Uncharacterized protein n=1 Tax=Candidatus Entotheonella gemina TaxID=1429439 RepID=W4MCG7_9BACT|nr:hypothetical protein [Candidatus Entotheonella palauensis]ETX08049.1 MAG: hypothetical protein ETSY2_07640 [Candidatus Entotheonella gemina]
MAKTASLHPEPPDRFALKSTYDPALVALIKNMPADQRAWHAGRRVWLIHISRHGYVLAILQQLHYQVTDHVEAAMAKTEQQAPPGIWLLAGHPDVGQMQAQCPVCWNREQVFYHATYADAGGTTHLQFYSSACGHMWELCLQSAFGRLTSWTEVVEAAHDDDHHDVDAPETTHQLPAANVLHGALEAHRQRLQTFDFDTWLEQAMDEEDEDDEPFEEP